MTTTSVKDVSTILNAMTAKVGNAGGAMAGASFQSVWNNQTGKSPSYEEADSPVSGTRNTDQRSEVLKANETVRKPLREEKAEPVEENAISEEQTEAAMEALGTAANEMLYQVADTFDMSVEELKQLMDEMGMSPVDLLNPEYLGALLLKVAGAEDSVALLTNGELYADFKQLMSKQQELLNAVGSELGLSTEQLAQLIQEGDEMQMQDSVADGGLQQVLQENTEEPVIEVVTETDEADDTILTKDNKETVEQGGSQIQAADETIAVQDVHSKSQTDSSKEQYAGNSNEQTGNLFLQNLKNEIMQPEVSAVQTTPVWDADTQEIMRQIMDYMRIQVKPGMSDLEMQLHPESMGTLQIHVSSKGGVLTANFVTQNETVKAALESQMVQLKESFAEQGVKVEHIEVTVQTHQFERNLDQGRGSSNQGEAERKNRTRRINLNALSGLEESEEMTPEETLAAEMMTANGNTVDYTA